MKYPQIFRAVIIIFLTSLIMTSCVSRKEIVYFQGLEKAEQVIDEKIDKSLEIKPNDLLAITVAAAEIEAAVPFNLPVTAGGSILDSELRVAGTPQLQTYLVDNDGNIEFPVLGTLNVKGLNRQKLSQKLKSEISVYVQDPIVNVRIVNFQVSVLGEVARPGTFDVRDEYLSLPKALGFAGDLTIYGRRDNVLVMREENGKKIHAYLDLTDPNVINSPFYYLQQNDVIYVEPNSAQRQSASYNRNAGVYISIASVLISLAVLLTR